MTKGNDGEQQKAPNLKRLEELFHKAKESCHIAISTLHTLNREEERIFGFTHNDRDLDYIIDTIDYDQGTMTFNEFVQMMNEEKRKTGRYTKGFLDLDQTPAPKEE